MKICITPYKSQAELQRAHPEIKNFKVIYHAPRGQTADKLLATLREKEISGDVYQVGCFIWQEVKSLKLCSCLEKEGDDATCPIHGGTPCPTK